MENIREEQPGDNRSKEGSQSMGTPENPAYTSNLTEQKEQKNTQDSPTPPSPHQENPNQAGMSERPTAFQGPNSDIRPAERAKAPGRTGARGTAAMDPKTRQEVARKGGLAVSRNRQHMAEIGRKGGQSVSKNREHMAQIGRKGGAASRGHR